MQKVFNVLSIASFVMSGAMLIGTVMFYTRIPSLTKYYMSELKLELTELLQNAMSKQIEEAVPELPTKTGLPIKSP